MGYVMREIEGGSTSLSSLYPSFYRELQIHNWTPVDIVITDHLGKQDTIPRWPKVRLDNRPYVEIEYRTNVGMRTKEVKGRTVEAPIPTKKFSIEYKDFLLYPLKVEELGIIISTKEHSLLAKNLVVESGYSPDSSETLSDYNTTDPRFVFEVKDPFNRWEFLYLNVLGQTIELRCGHRNQIIADLDETEVQSLSENCTLNCYLRYPSNYVQGDNNTKQVFTINLRDIDLEEPYQLPSGDVVCVASSYEALQRVVQKRHSGNAGIQIAGMISKEVHDQTVENLKHQIEEEQHSFSQQIKQAKLAKDIEIADLRDKLEQEKRKTEAQAQQLVYWNSLHESSIDRCAREDKLSSQREKMRQESYDNSRKDTEAVWTALKIGGTVAAGIISFALTLLIKSSKK